MDVYPCFGYLSLTVAGAAGEHHLESTWVLINGTPCLFVPANACHRP